jgi:hypothetical protein
MKPSSLFIISLGFLLFANFAFPPNQGVTGLVAFIRPIGLRMQALQKGEEVDSLIDRELSMLLAKSRFTLL